MWWRSSRWPWPRWPVVVTTTMRRPPRRCAGTTTTSSTDVAGADTATGSTISAADATEADYLAAIERSLSSARWRPHDHGGAGRVHGAQVAGDDRRRHPQGAGHRPVADRRRCQRRGRRSATSGSPTTGHALYDAFGECDVDIQQKFVEFVTEGQSADVAACVADALTPDLLRRLMVSSLVEAQPDDELRQTSPRPSGRATSWRRRRRPRLIGARRQRAQAVADWLVEQDVAPSG